MLERKRKHRCRLSRRCPECYGTLEKIEHKEVINNVTYTTVFIECFDCDYNEEISDKRNKRTIE